MSIGIKKIIKLFDSGNVCVTGLRGSGKDMLMSNVVVRRMLPYISNVNYGDDYIPLDMDTFNINNSAADFVSGDVKFYKYPYPDGVDLYISDAGVYFPSQDFARLNKRYEWFSGFMALSRHLGCCNVHFNVQNLNRVWDKIREQSDIYIRCRSCVVIFGIVFQHVVLYDVYDSCVNRVPVFPMKRPLFNAVAISQYKVAKSQYLCSHGNIKNLILIYKNRSSYDTRIFKSILENGKKADICDIP